MKILLRLIVSMPSFWGCIACGYSHEQSHSTASKTVQNLADSTSNRHKQFIIDTTRQFVSLEALGQYRDSIELRFWEYQKNQRAQSPNDKALSFRLDSLKFLNQDFFTYMAFRQLQNTDKNQKNLFWIEFGLDFSRVVTIQQRWAMFNQYPKNVRESAYGKLIKAKLARYLNETTQQSPLFHFPMQSLASLQLLQTNGSKISLGQLLSSNHEQVLLIFGASWCGPCRYENHLLTKRIAQIDTSKVKLIGISIDTDHTKWLKMLSQDQCPWTQVRYTEGLQGLLPKKLQLQGVPTNILLNQKREIISEQTNIELILEQWK